jgi:hypothetical protein
VVNVAARGKYPPVMPLAKHKKSGEPLHADRQTFFPYAQTRGHFIGNEKDIVF